ncbi:hypothetical protein [Halobacterium yunchengense]|uniref:hypothetical protein n=1 Tax=Halobacterium yunchengense TaxID=3108497 RepID=UPI00300BB224
MTRVGLLGDGANAAANAVGDAGGEPVVGRDAVGDVDVLVALGEDALLDAVEAQAGTPVLPVDAGAGYGGVARDDLPEALADVATGDYEVRDQPTLSATVGGEETRALADVHLVTDEPARISEYAIRDGDDDVDTVRADGVVAATPAGSRGYASDAGGPLLSGDADTVAVVPIAPFRVAKPRWVLGPPVSLTVVRETAAVAVFADGRDAGYATPDEPVELAWGVPLPVAVVAASAPAASSA